MGSLVVIVGALGGLVPGWLPVGTDGASAGAIELSEVATKLGLATSNAFDSGFPARRMLAGVEVSAPGTRGHLTAHNGEVRFTETDLSLPGRRMGIQLTRTYTSQDRSVGYFGPGFDFSYNEHLVPLKTGQEVLLYDLGRNQGEELVDAESVVLSDGAGHLFPYTRYEGAGLPAGIANDALLWDDTNGFGYAQDDVAESYVPPQGRFDIILKLESETYVRVTPDGTRSTYSKVGWLDSIEDRFGNRTVLTHRQGLLRRVEDESVGSDDRYIEFGYYLPAGAETFITGLDRRASSERFPAKPPPRLRKAAVDRPGLPGLEGLHSPDKWRTRWA